MKPSTREALSAYYKEAGSWAHDQLSQLQRSRRTAWIIAAGAAALAVVEGVALIVLMPLKTVEPYTLMVDRTTGYVQQLKPLEPGQITPDQALVQSMLAQYVIARESYDEATVHADYRKVGLWSAETARTAYAAQMQPTNPASPLAIYSRTTVLRTQVKSVSPLAPDTALVRFETFTTNGGSPYGAPRPWVAVIRYRFSGEAMSAEDRFLNPLGFQVIEYRRDAEAPPPPAPVDAGGYEGPYRESAVNAVEALE